MQQCPDHRARTHDREENPLCGKPLWLLRATARQTARPRFQMRIQMGQEARQGVQLRQGSRALRQYLIEFGLTPSARTRVTVPPARDPDDAFAEFD